MPYKLNPDTRTFMKLHNLTGRELAKRLGVAEETVSRWLNAHPIGGLSALDLLELFSELDPKVSMNDIIIRVD